MLIISNGEKDALSEDIVEGVLHWEAGDIHSSPSSDTDKLWLWVNHLISSHNFLKYKIHTRLDIFKVPSSKTHYMVLYSLEISLKILYFTNRKETTYSSLIRHLFIHPFIYSQFTSICYRAGAGISPPPVLQESWICFLGIHPFSNPFLLTPLLGHALEKWMSWIKSEYSGSDWNMVEVRGW